MLWRKTEITKPETYLENVRQFHLATQYVAIMDFNFHQTDADENKLTLCWCDQPGRVIGHIIKGEISFRTIFDPAEFMITLQDLSETVLATQSLLRQKERQVLVWLEGQSERLGLNTSAFSQNLPYQLPDYRISNRKPFRADQPEQKVISRLFSNACLALKEIRKRLEGLTDIRIFPRHLYMETMSVIKDTGDPETSACVRLGFSPGDEIMSEPYFYANVLPFPSTETFPLLTYGEWYEDEWAGAVYRFSMINEIELAETQLHSVVTFLDESFRILKDTIK